MQMKPAEFITLSACTMMLTALGIDIMLPAFGEIRKHFGLGPESTDTAQIITFFFMGQIAQLVFGVLSDRFGRLAILRIGFPLYIVGGLAATFAPTLTSMFIARFIAGMGASAVFTTTIAGVRDRFVGDKMARIMSLILTIFLFTPVFAPFLGIAILHVASWKMVFLTPPLFAIIIFLWSLLRLKESLPPERRSSFDFKSIIGSVRRVVTNTIFLRYTITTTVLFIGLSSWVSSSEHIVGGIYGRPDLFAWIFAGIGALMSLCALTNSRLSAKYGARFTLKWLVIVYTIVSSILLLIALLSDESPKMAIFFTALALLMAINITIEPNSSALALEPMGERAGIASAVYGTVFFFTGSSIGSIVSYYMINSVFPLVLSFFLIGVVVLILVHTDRRPLNRTVL